MYKESKWHLKDCNVLQENCPSMYPFNCPNTILFLSVIGRGGEQINKLQSETGAKIQVAPGKL